MTTAPDFSVRDVLQWARTKPADERYRYSDVNNCAVAQFCRHQSVPLYGPARQRLEDALAPYVFDTPYYDGWREFGALVTRLEALCPDTTPSEWTRVNAYMEKVS